MKAVGRSPLLIYSGNPPVALEPFKIHQRDIVLRFFERCAASRVPAIEFENLLDNLSESRKRRFFLTDGRNYSDVVLYGGERPPAPFIDYADELILFINSDSSSPGWVYNTLRRLSGKDLRTTARAVIVNARGTETAAVFFHLLKEELDALLGRECPLLFAGNVRLDRDLAEAALPAGRTIVEVFPGSRFHGEIKHVVRNLTRGNGAGSEDGLFSRLVSSMEKKPSS
jgi:MinD-like ATPase involved in chromosome partitioning or flagellar assembly